MLLELFNMPIFNTLHGRLRSRRLWTSTCSPMSVVVHRHGGSPREYLLWAVGTLSIWFVGT